MENQVEVASLESQNAFDSDSVIVAPSPCYFMAADLLGFSNLIENLTDDEQVLRINDWINVVEDTKAEVGIRDTQLISDTLFVREADSAAGLERLLRFAQLLINRSFNQHFFVRGAITHGNVAWGKLTFGTAVLQAYKLEQSFEWIGIAAAPFLPHIDSLWSWNLVACYPAPRKSGKVQLCPVVVWDVPTTEAFLASQGASGTLEDDKFKWEALSKVEGALQFGAYISLAQKLGLRPEHFSGFSRLQLIESYIGVPLS